MRTGLYRRRVPGPVGSAGVGSRAVAIVVAMPSQGFEARLERLVESTFGRIFRSDLQPAEFGRKLRRAMDDHRVVSAAGRTVVANRFDFTVAPVDADALEGMLGTLRRELAELARAHARDEGYVFVGPVEVSVVDDVAVARGTIELDARMVEGVGALPPGSLLLPTGDRVPLGEYVVSIGRHDDCTVVLADPNVSRNHAEVRPSGDGFAVVDLGSTNGTKVNGVRVAEHQLRPGDEVRFGNTVVRFEAS